MLLTKPALCTECRICQLICAWRHFGENNPRRARIWINEDWPDNPKMTVCRSCKNHDCVAACPEGALSWDGRVVLDESKCDRCGACFEACPVKGLNPDPDTDLPLSCDGCGGEYLCTKWCPTGAIAIMKGAADA